MEGFLNDALNNPIMIPRYHFIFGLIPAILLAFAEPLYGMLFLMGAFLIDFDHYLIYVLAFRDLSLSRAIRFFESKVLEFNKAKDIKFFLPLHNIEAFLGILVISSYIPLLYFVFFGMVFHYVLDLCYDYAKFGKFIREFSVIQYILRPNKFYMSQIAR